MEMCNFAVESADTVFMEVIYEDNHIVVVNKAPGEIVQGDKTGDEPLVETLRRWIKEKYNKPGNVFCGVVHRLDRPVGGLVVFAKTSKALSRLNEMFRNGEVHKTYWALSRNLPELSEGELKGYIRTIEKTNKSLYYASPREGAKEARLRYKVLGSLERYHPKKSHAYSVRRCGRRWREMRSCSRAVSIRSECNWHLSDVPLKEISNMATNARIPMAPSRLLPVTSNLFIRSASSGSHWMLLSPTIRCGKRRKLS